jgi:Tol biopolymer transport system component
LWPAVSPDNGQVAFQSIRNLSQGSRVFEGAIIVKAIKREESDRQVVITEHGSLPAWAPDGSTIAYAKVKQEARNLFVVNPNGGGERQLTTDGMTGVGYSVTPFNTTESSAFAWSPVGLKIAYLSDQNQPINVWLVDVRDGTSRQLTQNTEQKTLYSSPIWSSDGKQIAIAFLRSDTSGPSARGLIVINVETAEASQVYETAKRNRLVGWTSDNAGLIIAEPSTYIGLPPETLLKRIHVQGGTESSVANLKNVYYYNIFLSTDRRSIAYAARNDGRDDLWVIPTSGGSARKITSNNDSALYYSRLAWFNDGSALTFGKQTRFSLLSMITGID